MGQQPSIPTDPSRELKVIGAGFSRTGTFSFAIALEKLLKGPVCHSGTEILTREEEYLEKWNLIQDKTTDQKVIEKNLKELMTGYVATTDIPSNVFVEELCNLYPDAIVICSTRDVNSWYKSAQFLMKNTGLWWLNIVFWPMPTLRLFGKWRESVGDRMETAYCVPKQEMDGPQLLTMHEAYVRRVVPPERLFWFNVKDGWEPLCKILNCPVPDEPFPRANDKNAMETYFAALVKKALVRWVQILGGVGAVTGVLVWALWK